MMEATNALWGISWPSLVRDEYGFLQNTHSHQNAEDNFYAPGDIQIFQDNNGKECQDKIMCAIQSYINRSAVNS